MPDELESVGSSRSCGDVECPYDGQAHLAYREKPGGPVQGHYEEVGTGARCKEGM